MKLSWNLVFQAAATVVQLGNQISGFVPEKYQGAVTLIVGLAQALVAWKAHYSNPDGTPAAVPYVKK